MTIDEILVLMQVLLLSAIIIREMIRKSGRNLYAMLITSALLLIVHGQAWWMFQKFEETGASHLRHLYQSISLDGARLANLYLALFTAVFFLTYVVHSTWKRPLAIYLQSRPEASVIKQINGSLGTTVCALIWTSIFGYFLMDLAGGVVAAVEKPGQAMVGGVAMFLVLTGLGKFPLLRRVASGMRIRPLEIFVFVLSVTLCLLNSRFLTLFTLIQFTLLYNYGRSEISRVAMLKLGSVAFVILIVFGFYRDYTAKSDVVSMDSLVTFFQSRTGDDGAFEWFYSANVEGFAGLAGIVSYDLEVGGLEHDYGLSTLSFAFRFIPFQIRNNKDYPFMQWNDDLMASYPYYGSVVQPGAENFYAHWGLPGILVLGGILGFLASWLHLIMLKKQTDKLAIGVFSVHSLDLVRGSVSLGLFWFLCDLAMLFCFRSIDVLFARRERGYLIKQDEIPKTE